jgi:hypothetical protein
MPRSMTAIARIEVERMAKLRSRGLPRSSGS